MKKKNNENSVPFLLAIVGRSNSGKTTLLEKLVSSFSEMGKKISAIKTTHHQILFDRPDSDTARLKRAGAVATALSSPGEIALVSRPEPMLTPSEIAIKYFSDMDIVFVEGDKSGPLLKIEVIGDAEEEPLFMSGVDNICMLVSDRIFKTDIPIFKRDDINAIVTEIVQRFSVSLR